MIVLLNSSEIKYYGVINQLKHYMKIMGFPKSMCRRMLVYYDYRFQKSYYRESVIQAHLSKGLLLDINLHSCRSLIDVVPILNELPRESLNEIVRHLKYQVFLYNDTIIQAGALDNCMYFISRGTVSITTPTGREVILY